MEVLAEDSPMGMEEALEKSYARLCLKRSDRQEEEWSIPASVTGRNDSLVE